MTSGALALSTGCLATMLGSQGIYPLNRLPALATVASATGLTGGAVIAQGRRPVPTGRPQRNDRNRGRIPRLTRTSHAAFCCDLLRPVLTALHWIFPSAVCSHSPAQKPACALSARASPRLATNLHEKYGLTIAIPAGKQSDFLVSLIGKQALSIFDEVLKAAKGGRSPILVF